MKNIFYILLCSSLLLACKKDDTSSAENQTQATANYQLDHVTFLVNDHTTTKSDSTILFQKQIVNNASNSLDANIGVPTPDETSKFTTTNPDTRLMGTFNTKIGVPVALSEEVLHTGEKQWTYSANKSEGKPANVNQYKVTLSVTPYTKINLDVYAKWETLHTDYVATFKDANSGKTLEVNGTWEGRQLRGYSHVVVASNIK